VIEVAEGDDVPPGMVREFPTGARAMKLVGDDERCIALDPQTRMCTIYDRRPTVCREFPYEDEKCFGALSRYAVASRHEYGDEVEEVVLAAVDYAKLRGYFPIVAFDEKTGELNVSFRVGFFQSVPTPAQVAAAKTRLVEVARRAGERACHTSG
jgi:hypothetical protein